MVVTGPSSRWQTFSALIAATSARSNASESPSPCLCLKWLPWASASTSQISSATSNATAHTPRPSVAIGTRTNHLNNKADCRLPPTIRFSCPVVSASLLCDQFAYGILLRHLRDRNRLVITSMSRLAKLHHALCYNLLHRVASWLQVVARIELLRRLHKDLTNRARNRKTVVGVHVDLAHAVLDAELDLFHRHSPSLLQLATVLVHDVLQVLGY